MLWAVFTLIAAAAQTARNAMQRELTVVLGTVGATHVRFLFGFPFAVLFLAGLVTATGARLPNPPYIFWPWVLTGAFTQIAATATMLSVMGQRSFVVAYAYIKTEPVHVALFGLIFLGDKVTPLSAAAILMATAGVIVISLKAGAGEARTTRSTIVGLLSGALFGHHWCHAVVFRPMKISETTLRRGIAALWVIAVIAATVQQGITHQNNNFLIFRAASLHLLHGQDLYAAYPALHFDFYKYSPSFALLFLPFARAAVRAVDAAVERAQRRRALVRASGMVLPRRGATHRAAPSCSSTCSARCRTCRAMRWSRRSSS